MVASNGKMVGQRMARSTSRLPSAKLCLEDLTHERRLGKMSNMLTAAFVPRNTGKREVVEVSDRWVVESSQFEFGENR